MPLPIAQSLFQQIFGSSLPTVSLTKPTETSDQEGEDVVRRGPAISFQDVLTRQFLGPTVLPKTMDTSSGKVFAPDDPIPAKPDILATYPEKEKETKIISSPLPTGEPQGLMGLPMPETQDKLKGFEKPQDVDTSVLMINKIPTWEKYFKDKEEFEKTAKKNNITEEELEKAAVEKQITFKRQGYDYDIYFDGKLIGQLNNATKGSGGELPRSKYGDAYNVLFIDSSLNYEGVDTLDGLDYSKNRSKKMIAYSLLDKTFEDSLANIFPNIKYDKKGKPIEYIADEKIEQEYLDKFINAVESKDYTTFDKIRNFNFENSPLRSENFKNTLIKYVPKVVDLHRQEAIDKQNAIEEIVNKPSNPTGSLIDKPLSNE